MPSRNSSHLLHHPLHTEVQSAPVHVLPGEPQLRRKATLIGADSWRDGGGPMAGEMPLYFLVPNPETLTWDTRS